MIFIAVPINAILWIVKQHELESDSSTMCVIIIIIVICDTTLLHGLYDTECR